jgi:hypothetical protein
LVVHFHPSLQLTLAKSDDVDEYISQVLLLMRRPVQILKHKLNGFWVRVRLKSPEELGSGHDEG